MFFTKSTQSTQNWKHQSVEITEVWHRWSGSDPLAGFTERKPNKSYPKMKILGSVGISRIGWKTRTQNTQSKNPWNSDISRAWVVDEKVPLRIIRRCRKVGNLAKYSTSSHFYRGSNPGHPARLTPYYKVLQDAVRCYLVMLHCSDCNGYKALATGYNTK